MDKSDNKILFLVDHKHRDLPSLSLIGFYLEKFFFKKIYYVATSLEDKLIKKINPKYIIIPKITYGISKQIKWKLEGRKIIIIETEGNPQNDAIYHNITVYPDLYFFWNKKSMQHYYKKLERNGTKMIIGGNYRTDIFCKPFKTIFNANETKERLGITNYKKIITFATSTQEAHRSKKTQKKNRKKLNKSYKFYPSYSNLIDSLYIQKDITEDFLIKSKDRLSEGTLIVIKPHPHESIIYWENFFKKNNLKNCKLIYGTNINELLSISDIHISHGICSTTAEAKLWGLQTIEIWTNYTENIYSEPHTLISDYKCYSSEQIFKIIENFERGKLSFESKNETFDIYKKNYFKKVSGKVCYDYAKYINDFLKNDSINNLKKFNLIKYYILFFIIILRNIFFQREKIIYNHKTSFEVLGLFDNKIKENDYKLWYEKFSSINLRKFIENN